VRSIRAVSRSQISTEGSVLAMKSHRSTDPDRGTSVAGGKPPRLHLVSDNDLAAMIRAERAARSMSQADLARKFGVRSQTIGAWEKGETPPQVRFFDPIAQFLGLRDADQVRQLLQAAHNDEAGPHRPDLADELATGGRASATGPELEIRLNISRRIASGEPLSADEVQLFKQLLAPIPVSLGVPRDTSDA